ncbi:MAG: hypothetical protein ACYSW8_26600, partial [Planctomycetota bacterium]
MRTLFVLLLLAVPCSLAFCQEEDDPHYECEMAMEEFWEMGDECYHQRGGVTGPAKLDAEGLKQDFDDADQSLLTFGESKHVADLVKYAGENMTSGNDKNNESLNWIHNAGLKFGEGETLCAAGDHEGAVSKFACATSYMFTALLLQYDAQAYYETVAMSYTEALDYIWWASESNECLECYEKDVLCSCDPDNQPEDPEEPEDPE